MPAKSDSLTHPEMPPWQRLLSLVFVAVAMVGSICWRGLLVLSGDGLVLVCSTQI